MNARNKLKTIDLMRLDTHIVYHAQRIITEYLKTDDSWGNYPNYRLFLERPHPHP